MPIVWAARSPLHALRLGLLSSLMRGWRSVPTAPRRSRRPKVTYHPLLTYSMDISPRTCLLRTSTPWAFSCPGRPPLLSGCSQHHPSLGDTTSPGDTTGLRPPISQLYHHHCWTGYGSSRCSMTYSFIAYSSAFPCSIYLLPPSILTYLRTMAFGLHLITVVWLPGSTSRPHHRMRPIPIPSRTRTNTFTRTHLSSRISTRPPPGAVGRHCTWTDNFTFYDYDLDFLRFFALFCTYFGHFGILTRG